MRLRLTLRSGLALAAIALTVVPGLQTIAKADSTDAIPACAQPCLDAAMSNADCSFTHHRCMCGNNGVFADLHKEIKKACSPEDQTAMWAAEKKFCARHQSTTTATTTATPGALGTPSMTTTQHPTTSLVGPAVTSTTDSITPYTRKLITSVIATADSTYHKTLTYSTTTSPAVDTTVPAATGGAHRRVEQGVLAAAFAVLVGAMRWAFAEL